MKTKIILEDGFSFRHPQRLPAIEHLIL